MGNTHGYFPMCGQAPIFRNTFHQIIVNLTWLLPQFCWRYWPTGELGDTCGCVLMWGRTSVIRNTFYQWSLNSLGLCPSSVGDMNPLVNLIWGTPVGVSRCEVEILLSVILFIKWSFYPLNRHTSSVGDMARAALKNTTIKIQKLANQEKKNW